MAIPKQTIEEILTILGRRVTVHGDEVTEILRQVGAGELAPPELLSETELNDVREIFGWIAEVGAREFLEIFAPLPHALSSPSFVSLDLGGWLSLQRQPAPGAVTAFGLSILPSPRFEGKPALGALVRLANAGRHTQLRCALVLLSYVFHDDFHYPQPETGAYDIAASTFEKLKWLYRHQLNQLEVAQKGSGLEAHFAAQNIAAGDAGAGSRTSSDNAPVGRLSLSCGGDLLAVDVLTPENTVHLFDDITDFFSTTDIVSANLESTVSDTLPIGRYQKEGEGHRPFRMNTSLAMFEKFRNEAGINFFSTATNHAMDWGSEGVLSTLHTLSASGAAHAGTAASQEEQDNIVVIEKNGVKVALLAYTFDLNGYAAPSDAPYMVNVVRFNDVDPEPDYALIEKQVALARARGADHVVAYCHWGWEFEMYPHVNIVEAARRVVACGVDTILGNHPHVSQPAEQIERDGLPPALVIYAFGDFVSYHPASRNSKLAFVVRFDIVKDAANARATVENLQALPIYIVNAPLKDGGYDCRIARFENVLSRPDDYGLSDLEKSQLPHLRDRVWKEILSPLSGL